MHSRPWRPRRCWLAARRSGPVRCLAGPIARRPRSGHVQSRAKPVRRSRRLIGTDMIQILESAAVDGAVTPTALAALEMLTTPQNEAILAYARLCGGAGRAMSSTAIRPMRIIRASRLGNLAEQTSRPAMATTLPYWSTNGSTGTDLPAIDAVCLSSASYSVVAGPLYGDNPNPMQIPSSNDDEQGSLGDCYLIAALGAIADSFPSRHRKHDYPQRG